MNEINEIIDEANHYIKKTKRNYFPLDSKMYENYYLHQAIEIVKKIDDLMVSLEEKRDQIYHNPIGEYEIDAIEVQLSKLYNKGFELMQSFEITCEDI
jgi:hypothetical protein